MSNKLPLQTPNLTAQNIDKIAALFPNCITEMLDEEKSTPDHKVYKRGINFELLKQMLSPDVVDGDEAYEFTWVGKKASIVEANKPIRKTLRPCPAESKNWDDTENLYIEGDNLEVLKLLQESYLGKVKMIYIDPPYNTGNDFIYADDFMRSQDEENRQMGMYDEDENRLFKNNDSNGRFHSDWCSMMYSRLMLARNLLTDDGVIFISIDDNECANLLKICEDIFSKECFVADISWQRTYSPRNDSLGIVREVEHLVAFSKQNDWMPNKLPRSNEMDGKYKNPDNDVAPWTSSDPCAADAFTHQGMVYAIQHPFTGQLLYPSDTAHWRYKQEDMLAYMQGWCPYELKDLDDAEQRAKICGVSSDSVRSDVKGIVLSLSLEESRRLAQKVYDNGPWPRFYFTKGGQGGIRRKTYLDTVGGKLPTNFWPYDEVGHTDEAKKEIKNLFDGTAPFDTPKPVRLVERILTIATDENSLILDFFSGSATTAHAVMKKNAEDNGKRKYILVQLQEKSNLPQYDTLCDIGKERIRRAGDKLYETLKTSGKDFQHIAKNINTAPRKTFASDDGQTSFEVPIIPTRWGKADETAENQKLADSLDIGFRVFKLDDTNMKDVYYSAEEYSQTNLEDLESNIKEDRTDLDLLFGCLLDWGLPLSMPYRSEKIDNCTVHTYAPGDAALNVPDALIACFDSNVPENVIKEIAKRKPRRAVFRDSSFASSPEKINVFEIFKLYAPDTDVKVI